ncbi:unnamed protein product [Leptosia nina]|uniref:PLAC domain-containing protein n=1 Tax=Leptosia nina TaxID=320188 RepID=A0AAV1JP50_9NEOP
MSRLTLFLVLLVTITQVTSGPYNGLHIPSECTDNPFFADCSLIVRSKFCHHKYYSSFCCKSCIESGQLDPTRTFNEPENDYWN